MTPDKVDSKREFLVDGKPNTLTPFTFYGPLKPFYDKTWKPGKYVDYCWG